MANYCCGNCDILNLNDCKWDNEYYCKIKGKYIKQSESACSNFCKNKDTREKESHEYHRAGWYIVTAISKILTQRYGSDFGLLNTLFVIRFGFLEKDEEYKSTLEDYDLFGPKIAELILNDENALTLALEICSKYLLKCSKLVTAKRYQEAAFMYMKMVEMLKVRYNLISVAIEENMDNEIKELNATLRTRKKVEN